jgi:hypothetical protein
MSCAGHLLEAKVKRERHSPQRKAVCTVRYCPHNPPHYTPRPGRKCSTFHCDSVRWI